MAALCEDCDGCCRVFEVASIAKPFGVPCQHLGRTPNGPGCTIYGQHPIECQHYVCVWLHSRRNVNVPNMRDDLRPDRCKVVMGWPFGIDRDVMYIYPYPDHPDAWKRSPVKDYIQEILHMGAKVLIFVNSDHIIYAYGNVVKIGTEAEFADLVFELRFGNKPKSLSPALEKSHVG